MVPAGATALTVYCCHMFVCVTDAGRMFSVVGVPTGLLNWSRNERINCVVASVVGAEGTNASWVVRAVVVGRFLVISPGVVVSVTTVLLLFFAGYFGARAFGVWNNQIGDGEYVQRIQEYRHFPYTHPGM